MLAEDMRDPLRVVFDLLGLADILAVRAACVGLRDRAREVGAVGRAVAGPIAVARLSEALRREPPVLGEGWAREVVGIVPRDHAAFRLACELGRVGLARAMWRLGAGPSNNLTGPCWLAGGRAAAALAAAVECDRPAVVEWLWGELAAAAGGRSPPAAADLFELASREGLTAVARVLAAGIRRATDCAAVLARLRGGASVAAACGRGDPGHARAVAELLGGLARADGGPCCPLAAACRDTAGHLEVARWVWGELGAKQKAATIKSAWGGRLLLRACESGALPLASWLHGLGFRIPPKRWLGCAALHNACGEGRLDLARWLWSAGASRSARRPMRVEDGGLVGNALGHACAGGHLALVEWLWSAGLGLDDVRATWAGQLSAFGLACVRGHLEVARWLWARGLGPADAGPAAGCGCPLIRSVLIPVYAADRMSVISGGVLGGNVAEVAAAAQNVAEWLWAVRPVMSDLAECSCLDPTGEGAPLLAAASFAGDLVGARWLWSCGLTLPDARAAGPNGLRPLAQACARGDLAFAAWLWSLGLGVEDAREGRAFALACGGGHLEVAEWLWSLGLTLEDARDDADGDGAPFARACLDPDGGAIARWLWGLGLGPNDLNAVDFVGLCCSAPVEFVRWFWDTWSPFGEDPPRAAAMRATVAVRSALATAEGVAAGPDYRRAREILGSDAGRLRDVLAWLGSVA